LVLQRSDKKIITKYWSRKVIIIIHAAKNSTNKMYMYMYTVEGRVTVTKLECTGKCLANYNGRNILITKVMQNTYT